MAVSINHSFKPKQFLRSKWWLLLPVVLLLIVTLSRNKLLHMAFERAAQKIQQRYGASLSAGSLQFSGIDEMTATDVVMHLHNDTLLRIRSANFDLAVWQLLQFRVAFNQVSIDTLLIDAHQTADRNNLNFTKQNGAVVNAEPSAGTDFLEIAKKAERSIYRLLHTAIELHYAELNYTDSSGSTKVVMPYFNYTLDSLHTALVGPDKSDTLFVSGATDVKAKRYQLTATHNKGENGQLPLVGKFKELKIGFRKIAADITLIANRDEMKVTANASGEFLRMNHWRLSADDVVMNNIKFSGQVSIDAHEVSLDSTSYVLLNKIRANLYARYTNSPQRNVALNVTMPETPANDFFGSLPQGMFQTLQGITCTGTLQYALHFNLPMHQPDSLRFSSELKRKNFTIQKFGAVNYSSINQPFTYRAYDKTSFVRSIEVGPSNPDFTPLPRISPFLIHSVLQSEDPSFMLHRGFYEEAFRESIIKNYKEKRFARGGSTISMQLVKNVFLNRNKTISRKAEEALIVYLIENLGLVSKERMLEIYLNVIEWGPGIYGVGEASRFYFNKTPALLNLQESIFLASIIPAPKYFRYRFTKEGQLRADQEGFFNILSERMLLKGWISPSDTIGLTSGLKLKGTAENLIVPADTITPETYEED